MRLFESRGAAFGKGVVFALAAFAAACAGQKAETKDASAAAAPSTQGDLRRALELVESGDLAVAEAELKALVAWNPSAEATFRMGHVKLLLGDLESAKIAYESYLARRPLAPEWDRAEVEAEIAAIGDALAAGQGRAGSTLASRRLRGELAELRGKDARAASDFRKAAEELERASQYIPDPDLVFESALAFTRAKRYQDAVRLFRLYLGRAGAEIPRGTAYAVQAEMDRLEVILGGGEPVTWESLADQIDASRATQGTAKPAPPPAAAPVPAAQPAESPAPTAEATAAPGGESLIEEITEEPTPAEKARAKRAEAAEEKKRKREERLAKIKADKEAKASAARREPAAAPPEASKIASPQTGTSGVAATTAGPPAPPVATVDELFGYVRSDNSAIRLRAVRDLVPLRDSRIRPVLEERMAKDGNLQVRLAAVDALVARGSVESVEAIRRATMTASTSTERAKLQQALRILLGIQ